MRVLIATGMYPPDIGGPATYSELLFRELPRYGHEASVVSFGEVRALPKIFRHAAYFFKLLSRARGKDMIFAQDPVSVGLPAMCAAKLLCKKFAVKIVGDYAWEQGVQRFGVKDSLDEFVFGKKKYGLRVALFKFVQKTVARAARAIVVPSAYLKSVVASWGVDEKKIRVIYNAFSPHRISINDAGAAPHPVVVSVGRLVPWKGFDTLIAVFPRIREHVPDAVLHIIGEGPDRERLARLIADKNLEECVVLKGKMNHADLLKHVARARVFALNTSYEGFSHQILEAMSVGTPVVTTRAGGNPELVEDGKEGFLVPYDSGAELVSKITEVLRGGKKVEEMKKAAKEKSLKFTKERMLRELSGLMSRI